MDLPRRQLLRFAAGAAAAPAISRIAKAQTYPVRPVRIIVGFAAGGPTDISARLIGQWLSERLGQQFIIENRPGAGGNIGTEAAINSIPDGYTLLLMTSANAINATLYEKLNFDFIRDIEPVAAIMRYPNVLMVNPLVPIQTVPEFIAFAKANPGKLNMASPGSGTSPHMSGELFKMMAGLNIIHVPYRGSGPALTDLIGGQVQVMFDAITSSIEFIRAGKLRAVAVTGATRVDALPNIPTVGEFVAGYEASGWNGLAAPKNTPAEIVGRLNKETNAAFADPKTKARFADLGGVPLPMSPAELRKFVADETEKWGKVVKFSGATPV